jgi:pilus assembly protein CpaB
VLQSVAGLVLPGDRVDLILTQNFGAASPDPTRKSVGEIVLRNIRVVAVDQRLMEFSAQKSADPKVPAAAPRMPSSVTLEVSDVEAEHVLVAQQLGRVQLVIRSLENSATGGSSTEPVPPPIWAGDVSPALRVLASETPMVGKQSPAPSGSTPGPQSPATLEVLRGSVSH